MPQEKSERKYFVPASLNSLCATPALLPFPDYPPPTATVPGALPAAGQAPFRSATRQIVLAKGVCTSISSADASITDRRLVRITHPFHPLSGKQLACVGERY